MKVLKDNYNNIKTNLNNDVNRSYPRVVTCGCCDSEIEYDFDDVYVGALGCAYIECPLCEDEIALEDNENSIDLNKDNVEFPTHFFHTCKENGAVDCVNNKEVKKFIKESIEYFRKNKDDAFRFVESGNSFAIIFRHEDDEDYYVIVSKDHYSTYIPFEGKDYYWV